MEDSQAATGDPPVSTAFLPPSIHREPLIAGASYSHFSPVPPSLLPAGSPDQLPFDAPSTAPPVALGVDEAGRGPVLGPMVYGVFYLPIPLSDPLLREAYGFDDSKVLKPAVRTDLMKKICTPGTDLFDSCGWAISSLSARDIGANMLKPGGNQYNLNAQAMDATVDLIKGVYARGVNIREIFVDTIGPPATYQAKLQRIFPTAKVCVEKKADSLYPCVSAASVCAKVTRDVALECHYEARGEEALAEGDAMPWGSGYPSDQRCATWLRKNMHPVFGWGPECRFSWSTAKDMLENNSHVKVEWPMEEDVDNTRLTEYFLSNDQEKEKSSELASWFGTPTGVDAF